MKKSHKNVNLSNKESQTSVKKTQKCKFSWKKLQTSIKRYKNVNLGYKKFQTSEKMSQKSKFTWQKITK